MGSSLEILQAGDGSEFDKSFAALERMHSALLVANNASFSHTLHGCQMWLDALLVLDREMEAAYNDNDKKELDLCRIKQIPSGKGMERLIGGIRKKLDVYERKLRVIHTAKGFNIKAKLDGASAAERDTAY